MVGIVVSDKMMKTRVVSIERHVKNKAYGKFTTKRSKFKIHEFKPLSAVPLGGDSGFAPVPAFTSAGVGSYTDNACFTMTWKGNLVTNDPAKAGLKIDNLAVSGLAVPSNSFALS